MERFYETIRQERIDAMEDWEYSMMLEAIGYDERFHLEALQLVTKELWDSVYQSTRGKTLRDLRVATALGEREVVLVLNHLYATRAVVVSERLRGLPGRPTKYFHLICGVNYRRDPGTEEPISFTPSYEPDLGGFVRCVRCEAPIGQPVTVNHTE